jgi:hypothetical protein
MRSARRFAGSNDEATTSTEHAPTAKGGRDLAKISTRFSTTKAACSSSLSSENDIKERSPLHFLGTDFVSRCCVDLSRSAPARDPPSRRTNADSLRVTDHRDALRCARVTRCPALALAARETPSPLGDQLKRATHEQDRPTTSHDGQRDAHGAHSAHVGANVVRSSALGPGTGRWRTAGACGA